MPQDIARTTSAGDTAKRRQRRRQPVRQPVGVLAPKAKPTGVFADTAPRAPRVVARPQRASRPVVRARPSEVKDTKGDGDVGRGRVASDRAISRARRQQAEVRDTKGAGDRLPEAQRRAHVERTLDRIADHVAANPKTYRGTALARSVARARPDRVGLAKDGTPFRIAYRAKIEKHDVVGAALDKTVVAPGLKVLDQTTRPLHGIAAGTDAALTGKPVLKAAGRGLALKDRTTFSDVLKHAGVKNKAIRGAAGFALDVGLDPTTYVTFGAGGVAKGAATSAAAKAAARAERAGMSKAGQATVARAAAKRAAARAPKGKGLTVSVATPRGVREVPGVRRGTAAAARGARAAGRTVAAAPGARRLAPAASRAALGARDLGREVRPQLRPAGADEAQHVAARQAARRSRASLNQADAADQAFARALQKEIGASNYAGVVKAIETGKVGALKAIDPKLHQAAVALRSRFRHAKRVRTRAGLAEGTIRDYFPHARQDSLEAGLGITDEVAPSVGRRGGRTLGQPGSSRARGDKRPIHEVNPERVADGKAPFSTDVPLVALNYGRETAQVAARSRLMRDLADAGRHVKPGQGPLRDVGDHEAVYHLGYEPASRTSSKVRDTKGGGELVLRGPAGRGRLGLRELDDAAADRVLAGEARPGRYVVLDRRVVEEAMQSARPARAEHTSGRVFDRATGTWKRVATATPGFHVRNAIGDTQMAYLAQPGHAIPRNTAQAGKALRRVSEGERAAGRTTAPVGASKKTIKVAGKRVPLDEFVAELREQGVIRSGYVGRELGDLTGQGLGATGRVRKQAGQRLNRAFQNREDLMRVATYKHSRDRGLSPQDAADVAAGTHIDYGDLSDTERRYLRRLFPFYTFSARAIPIHVKALLQKPGKFANLEKAREEIAKAFGGDEHDQRGNMQEYQQRQLPFVVGNRLVSAALPATALNELPTSANPAKYIDELASFTAGLLNPLIKTPAELYSNRSFFFRRDLENEKRPLVSAPDWVQHVPRKHWAALGITPDFVDPRTGRKVWGWRGKADYIAKLFPGPFNLANQLVSSGTNRGGQGRTEKALAGLSGVRVDPIQPERVEATRLGKQLATVQRQIGALNQQGVTSKTPTPEYYQLALRQRQLTAALDRLGRAGKPAVALTAQQQRARARATRGARRVSGAAQQRAVARARRAAR